ncbi:MAG: hypothetical protein KM296_01410 [Brockia lithotrophica]|nr:hypothetical protein [Brockia lithotrophica]
MRTLPFRASSRAARADPKARCPRDPGTSLVELLAGLVLLSLLLLLLTGIVSAMIEHAAVLEAQARARSERATLVRLLERTVKDATSLESEGTLCPADEGANASASWYCAVRILHEELTPGGEAQTFATSLSWDRDKGELRLVRTLSSEGDGTPPETKESVYTFSYLREVAFRPSGEVLYVRLRLGSEKRPREETFAVWTAVRP